MPPARINLRRAAAAEHALVGVAANDGDGGRGSGIQRQDGAVVLQQHDAGLGGLLRHLEPRKMSGA